VLLLLVENSKANQIVNQNKTKNNNNNNNKERKRTSTAAAEPQRSTALRPA
jgi:hypothetical protein